MPVLEVIDKFTGETIRHAAGCRGRRRRCRRRPRSRAFPAWAGSPAHRRSAILLGAADRIRARSDEFTTLIAREAGKAWKYADGRSGPQRRDVHVRGRGGQAACTARRSRWMRPRPARDASASTSARRSASSSAITPFNFPLNLVAHKVGPALAAGNTLVLKPAEETPLTAVLMAECLRDAGLPDGVMRARARRRCSDRGGARDASSARQGLLHRQPARRRAHPESRRAQARHPRARQQLGHHRGARRGPRRAVPATVMSRVCQLRPGLHQPAAAVRPRSDRRRVPRALRRRDPAR